MTPSLRLKFRILIGAAIVVHLLFFLYAQVNPESRFTEDSLEYIAAWDNLWANGIFYAGSLDEPIDPFLYSRRPPGYPVLIGIASLIDGDRGLVGLLQLLMTLLGAYFVWNILLFLGAAPWVRVVSLALYLLFPPQAIYTQMVMAEIPLQFTLLMALFFLSRFLQYRRMGFLFLFNLALAAGPLIKPIMMFFWIPGVVFHMYLFFRHRNKWILVLPLLPLLTILGWSYRNLQTTDYFHFSSITTSQMKLFSRPTDSPADPSLAESSRETREAFFKRRLENWPYTLKIHARGALFLFMDPGRYDIYQFLGMEHDLRSYRIYKSPLRVAVQKITQFPPLIAFYLVCMLIINLFVLIGFLYFLFCRDVPVAFKVFLILIVLYVVGLVGPIGVSRYRLSIEPYLIVSCFPFLQFLRARLARG